jgi:hypothetical protein
MPQAEPGRIANNRDSLRAQLALRLPIPSRRLKQPEKMMIAFGMMGALAVLVFLSVSSEISELFRRK